MQSWITKVPELGSKQFNSLINKINELRKTRTIFPERENVFKAFELIKFNDVKVVILGQDPYHGEGQANGLAFSVSDKTSKPPSLRNIFKEINNDVYNGKSIEHRNDLSRWADQGVLLLNTVLTVEKGMPLSHKKLGWIYYTDLIIRALSDKREDIVFILWGGPSRKKEVLIDKKKHLILQAAHPSPLSAYRGFFGCRHFSKTNAFLKSKGKKEIAW